VRFGERIKEIDPGINHLNQETLLLPFWEREANAIRVVESGLSFRSKSPSDVVSSLSRMRRCRQAGGGSMIKLGEQREVQSAVQGSNPRSL
jgi:hypothetical protein